MEADQSAKPSRTPVANDSAERPEAGSRGKPPRTLVVKDPVPGPVAVYRRVVIGYTEKGWSARGKITGPLIKAYSLDPVLSEESLRVWAFQIVDPAPTVAEVLAGFGALKAEGLVAYAEPNRAVRLSAAPADPFFDDQWAWRKMDAKSAWSRIQGSTQVEVAVVDSGIATNHEDLAVFGSTQSDEVGHGTMVGGTIGAITGNLVGGKGAISPVKLLGVKFFDAHTWPTSSTAAIAIAQAAAAGAQIICACWDVGYYSDVLRDAITNIPDVLVVAAAGNDGSDNDRAPNWPSSLDLPNLVAIMATDEDDERAWFSNWGASRVHLAAPGTRILTTYPYFSPKPEPPYTGYRYYSGTSASAAHAAGAAALLKALNTGWKPEQIKAHLMESVDLVRALEGKCASGGRLNMGRAVQGPLAVVKPVAGDSLPRNSLTQVFWTSSYKASACRTVSIAIEGGGGAWTTLASNVRNDGDFTVKLPANPQAKTRIRVAGEQGNFVALSGTFRIT